MGADGLCFGLLKLNSAELLVVATGEAVDAVFEVAPKLNKGLAAGVFDVVTLGALEPNLMDARLDGDVAVG